MYENNSHTLVVKRVLYKQLIKSLLWNADLIN